MPDGYGTHEDYIAWVKEASESRYVAVDDALRKAFTSFIETREIEVVIFSTMTVFDLATAISAQPLILKPLLASCNIAGRAIERDLGIKNIDTYAPKVTERHSLAIAGYIKPFLPAYMELPALSHIDRVAFIDKEIRRTKGNWEQRVRASLNKESKSNFAKRRFVAEGQSFELDIATPKTGEIRAGIDVKRIEARRDIHKRIDEIVNKAAKLKSAYPEARFGVVIYYPFIDQHANILSRLKSDNIDGVVFAAESDDSIESAIIMLLPMLNID